MSRETDVLDALDLALGHAAVVLGEAAITEEVALAQKARRGRGYLGGTLVLALAGGTGTGKSSLLNALAGERIAAVSALRPHTEGPLAWADRKAEPGLGDVLDRLGVDLRIAQDRFPGLCVIDLPDQDSVVAGHRATVERVLADVDVVAWVVDPEKYRDPALHDEYLAPLAGFYGSQFLFVLNKIDRLGDDLAAVVADFEVALAEDGLADVQVFPLAADPPSGSPVGIEAFSDHLDRRLDAKRLANGKLLGDVRRSMVAVAQAAGVHDGAGIDFERRWLAATRDAAEVLAAGHREDGLCRLEDFVVAVSIESGDVVGRRIRAEVTSEVIAAAVPPAPAGPAVIEAAMDDAIGVRLRALLWDRAVLAAALASVDVAMAQAAARPSR